MIPTTAMITKCEEDYRLLEYKQIVEEALEASSDTFNTFKLNLTLVCINLQLREVEKRFKKLEDRKREAYLQVSTMNEIKECHKKGYSGLFFTHDSSFYTGRKEESRYSNLSKVLKDFEPIDEAIELEIEKSLEECNNKANIETTKSLGFIDKKDKRESIDIIRNFKSTKSYNKNTNVSRNKSLINISDLTYDINIIPDKNVTLLRGVQLNKYGTFRVRHLQGNLGTYRTLEEAIRVKNEAIMKDLQISKPKIKILLNGRVNLISENLEFNNLEELYEFMRK